MKIIIINCFDTYEHRVDLLHDVFVEAGHDVKVLTSDYRHFEKVKRVEPKKDYLFFNAHPYQKNLSIDRLRSHSRLSNTIFKYLETKADEIGLIWVLIPPNSFVKDAANFKKNHGNIKIVFDLIDLWPETMPVGTVKNYFPFSIWKNLRDKHINIANLVVTECDLYQKKLEEVLRGIKSETLYLARPLIKYESKVNLPEDRISICYLGSINNIIDIDVIREIIIKLREYKMVELHIVGDGEKKDELIQTSESAGALVVFHGKVYDRDEKRKIFSSCHYGLNIMKESVCVGLTMKSMDYMEFGLPMINNIHGDTWDAIETYKMGINWQPGCFINNYIDEYRINTRKFFEDNLTTEVFARKVSEILGEI